MDKKVAIYSDNVKLSDDKKAIILIDQTQLPNNLEHIRVQTPEELYDAIFHLKVRGAPAIGIAAAYGIYVIAQQIASSDYDEFLAEFRKQKEYINSSRPTAVNLSWALNRMEEVVVNNNDKSVPEILELLEQESISIHEEDIAMCLAISKHGLTLLNDGDGVLTHCNAGPLATSKYGTALGPLLLGKERGLDFRVFADETRPLLQGARLTTYELHHAGIDVTLICDNMASIVMKNGWVNHASLGATA